MAINKVEIFIPGAYYHIYNRSNAKEPLFIYEENYRFFLEKYKYYVSSYLDTIAYCLMPNHFHFILKVKDETELKHEIKEIKNLSEIELNKKITLKFSHFFNAYTKAFNTRYRREGNLFSRQFKRKRITSEDYLKKLILYIHNNPVEAGMCDNPCEWKLSSYNELVSGRSKLIEGIHIEEVRVLFGDLKNFQYCHLINN
ncbi:MAG: transposase [Bacteroidia bacterium]